MICDDMLTYEIAIADSWSLANQRAGNASILDMRRAYPAHCPAHRSNYQANHIDSSVVKA